MVLIPETAVQHSVHPTGGSLRVFRPFAWLEIDSDKMALSRPAHQRVTQAVGRREEYRWFCLKAVSNCSSHPAHPVSTQRVLREGFIAGSSALAAHGFSD